MKADANTVAGSSSSVIRSFYRFFTGAALAVACCQTTIAGDDRYYQNALFNPSSAMLVAEYRGRVTIYDGLDNRDVERALDTQFERIDHMMFIRTQHVQEDGSVESDDDC